MKGIKTSTRTPEIPKLTKEALASCRDITRPERHIESPEVHPYLAAILSASKPGKETVHKLMEDH